MRFTGIIICVLLMCGLCLSETPKEEIERRFTEIQRDEDFNGNVLVAENGKIVFEKSLGFSNYENDVGLTKDSLFDIASITKTFTATAIMKLVEKRKLHLNESISKHLPELPYENVTIRHMLSHTSGIMEEQKSLIRKEIEGKRFDNAQLLKAFVKINPKLEFEPGTKWGYSNTNYAFLALVIERVSGQSYAEFIRKHIFRKAKMSNSFVLRRGVPANRKGRIVDSYFRDGIIAPKFINTKNMGFVQRYFATFENTYGEGKIYSTTRDLYRYHRALQKGKILKKRTQRRMYAPVKLSNGMAYKVTRFGHYPSVHGLGWEVARDQSEGKIVYHTGAEPGTKSYFVRNVEKDRVVIVLTNNYLTSHQACTFPMRILAKKPYSLKKKSIAYAIGQKYKQNGIESAAKLFRNLGSDENYRLSEDEMNTLGYELLETDDVKAAITIFTLNTEKYPKSGNAWDSLGEAYLKAGNKQEAIRNYEKSLELDSENDGARNILKKLRIKKQ